MDPLIPKKIATLIKLQILFKQSEWSVFNNGVHNDIINLQSWALADQCTGQPTLHSGKATNMTMNTFKDSSRN